MDINKGLAFIGMSLVVCYGLYLFKDWHIIWFMLIPLLVD